LVKISCNPGAAVMRLDDARSLAAMALDTVKPNRAMLSAGASNRRQEISPYLA
jgi:hypothetical protein